MAAPYCETSEVKEILGIAQSDNSLDDKITRCISNVGMLIDDELRLAGLTIPSVTVPSLLNRANIHLAAFDFKNPNANSEKDTKINHDKYEVPGRQALDLYKQQTIPAASNRKPKIFTSSHCHNHDFNRRYW